MCTFSFWLLVFLSGRLWTSDKLLHILPAGTFVFPRDVLPCLLPAAVAWTGIFFSWQTPLSVVRESVHNLSQTDGKQKIALRGSISSQGLEMFKKLSYPPHNCWSSTEIKSLRVFAKSSISLFNVTGSISLLSSIETVDSKWSAFDRIEFKLVPTKCLSFEIPALFIGLNCSSRTCWFKEL